MGTTFVAVDVETANADPSGVCLTAQPFSDLARRRA
jgi:hypothetical protein